MRRAGALVGSLRGAPAASNSSSCSTTAGNLQAKSYGLPAGAGLVELQEAGDWPAPTMPAHYARHQLAARGAVAKFRYQAGR